MTNDIDIIKKAIYQYDKALRIKSLNIELFEHLFGSVIWLQRYCEKYNIFLPKKDELERIIKKSEFLMDEIEQSIKLSMPDLKHSEIQSNEKTESNKGIR